MKATGNFLVENETDYCKGYNNGWGNGVFAGGLATFCAMLAFFLLFGR